MPNSLVLFEDTHWRFAQPVIQARGQTLDFSGSRLSAVFRESAGGPPIVEVTSDDGALTFVPGVEPYFLFDIPMSRRTWTTRRAVAVYADINRAPDPSKPTDLFPLGRTNVVVHPGTGSASIAAQATSPVLVSAQPYGGLTVAAPIQIGPQGPIDRSYTDEQVAILQGQLAAALGLIDGLSPHSLDFSRPAMAGSALLLLLGA